MEIRFACPKCGNKYRFDVSHAGEKMECTWCATTLTIPSPSGSSIAKNQQPTGGSAIGLDQPPRPGSGVGSGMKPGSGIGASPRPGSDIGKGRAPGGSGIGSKHVLIDDSSVERFAPPGPPPALDGSPIRTSSLLGGSQGQPGSVDPTEIVNVPPSATPPASALPRAIPLAPPPAAKVAAPVQLPPFPTPPGSTAESAAAGATIRETRVETPAPFVSTAPKTRTTAQHSKTQHSRTQHSHGSKKSGRGPLVLAAVGGGAVAAIVGISVALALRQERPPARSARPKLPAVPSRRPGPATREAAAGRMAMRLTASRPRSSCSGPPPSAAKRLCSWTARS